MIIKRKLFAVFNKPEYGTRLTSGHKKWRKDIKRNIKTAETISRFDPKHTGIVDKDSVGESIRQAKLNLDNSIEATKKWKRQGGILTKEDDSLLRWGEDVSKNLGNHDYIRHPNIRFVDRSNVELSIFPNNNKMPLTGELYNGERYDLDFAKKLGLRKYKNIHI